MTDNEIIKALECCSNNQGCDNCPLYASDSCFVVEEKAIYDLINRQKAENERLKAEIVIRDKIIDERGKEVIRHDNAIRSLHKQLDNLKAEAINIFVKCLKDRVVKKYEHTDVCIFNEIDNLVKEMTEQKE